MKIGLFCGCFDPVHTGHIRAAEAFRDAAGLDAVLLVPANGSYKKFGSAMEGGAHRLRMCALAVSGHGGLAVSGFEVRADEPPYTSDTVAYARRCCPGAEICLCMGSDAAKYVTRWACFGELKDSVRFLVTDRGGEAPLELQKSGAHVMRIPLEPDGVSSTAIRRALTQGTGRPAGLDGRVYQYIRDNSLYKQQKRSVSL